MLTPKEAANNLINKFHLEIKYWGRAKTCALIAVDEIINAPDEDDYESPLIFENVFVNYWKQVKEEIEKL